MVVPPALTHGGFVADQRQSRAEPNRAPLLFVLVVGAGIVAAVAAASATGPFAGLRQPARSIAATSHLVRAAIPATPIDASTLFPPPAPPAVIQKVVTVYDAPAPAPAAMAAGSDAAEGRATEGSARAASMRSSESSKDAGHAGRIQPSPSPSPLGGRGGGD
jgi:hypothetical protein